MQKKPTEPRTQVRFPQEVWDEMQRLAREHQRSFNGEVIWALRAYLTQQKGEPHESLQVPPLPDQTTK
jgi:hypothetical protein